MVVLSARSDSRNSPGSPSSGSSSRHTQVSGCQQTGGLAESGLGRCQVCVKEGTRESRFELWSQEESGSVRSKTETLNDPSLRKSLQSHEYKTKYKIISRMRR